MQIDPANRIPAASPATPSSILKRPYAHSALAHSQASTTDSRSPEDSFKRPPKLPRLDSNQLSSSSMRPSSSSNSPNAHRSKRGHRPSKPPSLFKGSLRGKGPALLSVPQDEALHDLAFIKQTYRKKELKKQWEENPKSPLSNHAVESKGSPPSYDMQEILLNGKRGWRVTVRISEDPVVIGVGDSIQKKEAEQLAALSALYQLDAVGLLDGSRSKGPKNASVLAAPVTLSDGSTVTYEQARQFMDYYCRRYKFTKPDIVYNEVKGSRNRNSSWEAIMHVGGRRIGIGSGITKKLAQTNCYVDVTQYLESCDAELWKTFVKAAAEGKDLGMAPKVLFQMSDGLEDEVRDLCNDIRKSTLYQNRPASFVPSVASTSTRPVAIRRAIPTEHLDAKSERLSERRKAYLENPQLESMRNIRKALPVSTRSADLLAHVRDNEVTVCMAATGSGKTTQIPQLILDDYIDRGEGAKCNIICTQPRRLAAISVAERVAKERGEITGKGSVGYQVRFEAKVPEDHGSITFCTTGIFLRRMQTALLEGGMSGGVNLDDVTHVVVDEVHERDVDTDLLLVVLKRLLADRKARGKPIKVVLMSATIDPTLFQKYFPDDDGLPAGVIDIPGRSFPVQKHYLNDFVQELASDPSTKAVFSDDSVSRYLQQELGDEYASLVGDRWRGNRDIDITKDQDLELPYLFIALTITHIMKQSSDGHVLVFLPGWDEIQAVQRVLYERPLGLNIKDSSKFAIHLLHSTIPLAEQQAIFEPPPAGVRRIILSTNIAETSVTIPDVVYVVDTGKIKEQRYDPQRHMSSLVSAWVGTSNLNQRAGRAGRHRSGEYYGILGRKRVDALHTHQTVEMKRVNLTNVVMHVKALEFPGMAVEDVLAATIEPPAAERVTAAMKDLQVVGAIDENQNLTSLGRVLLQLPVEVQVGRLVLYGSFFRCLDQALTLAAILTNRDPFVSPMHLKIQAAAVKNSWSPDEFRSDTLAALRAYNAWWALQSNGEYVSANRFCSDNFLSKPTLLLIEKIKKHLLSALENVGVIDVSGGGRVERFGGRRRDVVVPPELNTNGDSHPLLAALIAIATQPNFAIRTGDKTFRTQQDKMTFIHPSSVNHRKRELPSAQGNHSEKMLIAFAEKRQNISAAGANASTAQMSLVTTTRLDPMTYVLFGAYRTSVTERGLECDDWLPVVGNIYALDDIQRLKTMMEGCMLRVFEGILMNKRRHSRTNIPIAPREEEESGDEEDAAQSKDYSLSTNEVKELDYLTRDIVGILNRYADERVASQSRSNSRPATPMGSPSFGSTLLPPRSGTSTPYGIRSAYSSRPSTPSRLGRSI